MAKLVHRFIPHGRPPKAPRATLFSRLHAAAAVCQSLTAIMALVVPLLLGVVNFTTTRYLAAFGHPGLSSFGDVAGFSVAALPFVLWVVVIAGLFAAFPVYIRLVATTGAPHAFAPAFDWSAVRWSRFWRSEALWSSAGSYAALYAVHLIIGLFLILSIFVPGATRVVPIWKLLSAIIVGVICYGLWRVEATGMTGSPPGAPYATTLGVALLASLGGMTWLLATAKAALNVLGSRLPTNSDTQANLMIVLIIAILMVVHFLATAAPRQSAMTIGAVMVSTVLIVAGDQSVLALSLRMANLGGGAPIAYRASQATKDTAPVTACLILAAGDTRIVWIPPAGPKGKVAPPCEWTAFKAALDQGAMAVAAGTRGAALDVRTFKREDLYDKP